MYVLLTCFSQEHVPYLLSERANNVIGDTKAVVSFVRLTALSIPAFIAVGDLRCYIFLFHKSFYTQENVCVLKLGRQYNLSFNLEQG